MLNITTESTATVMGGENDGVNHDSGDGVSNLNPDDIESMSILKVRLPLLSMAPKLPTVLF